MTNLIRSNFQVHPFHLIFPSPLLYISIVEVIFNIRGVLKNNGFSLIILIYFNILLRILEFLLLTKYGNGFVFINKKRGSNEQSTDKTQDKEIENRQAKNLLNDTLNKLSDLEQKRVPEDLDQGKSIPSKDSKTAKQIEEQYPSFFDEDSGNSDNKKQGYSELKEYLQEELDSLSSIKETSVMEESTDRDTKKPKPSSNEIKDESEGKENPSSDEIKNESEGKPTPSSSESEAKGKGSLIDDYANPNNEFGDWTGGED